MSPGAPPSSALAGGATIEEAEAFLAGLGPAPRANLDGVSPSGHVDRLLAPLYLLHDRSDAFVPWVESEALGRRPRAGPLPPPRPLRPR